MEEDMCALLLALGHGLWKMDSGESGCRGVLKVIVAALSVTCARFSSVVVSGLGCLRIVGLLEGWGEIPTQLRMTATPAGAVTSLEASSRPSPACPSRAMGETLVLTC